MKRIFSISLLLIALLVVSACMTNSPSTPGPGGSITPTPSPGTPVPTTTPLPTITPPRTSVPEPTKIITPPRPVSNPASSTPGAGGMTEYIHPGYPFRVSLPSNWTQSEPSGTAKGIAALSNPDETVPRGIIIVTFENGQKPTTPGKELENAAQDLRGGVGVSGFKQEAQQPVTINGLQGMRQCYNYSQPTAAMRQCIVVLQGTKAMYTLTLLAPQNLFSQYEPLFNTVLASFREI